jgi:hypothetical protein
MTRCFALALTFPLALVATIAGCDPGSSNSASGGSPAVGGKATGGSSPKGGSSSGGAVGGGGAAGASSGGTTNGGATSAGSSAGGTGGSGGSGGTNGGGLAGSLAGGGGSGGSAAGGTASGGSAGSTASAGKGGTTGGGAGGVATAGGANAGSGGGSANPMMNFFVSSHTSTTANLGGLAGADQICQTLATAVGQGNKTWRAYLSAATPATNAKDRIGPGPYYNAKGDLIAADKAALHARSGDAALFLDERGARINGQWTNSPTPLEHDILTGSNTDGTLLSGMTCGDWSATTGMSQVGHSDGLGPNMQMGTYASWNSVHTGQCGDTAPGGGAGRIYCFVAP